MNLSLSVLLTLTSIVSFAQTMYVPGTIGTSTNSNVGIGTGSNPPDAKLEVVGPSTGSGPTIRASGGGDVLMNSGGTLFFDGNYSYASGNFIRPIAANTQAFFTAGVERLRINSAGKTGIGTSNPLSSLTIQSNVSSGSVAYPLSVASLAPDAASGAGVGMSFFLGGNSTESQRGESARITVKQTYYGVRPSFTISTTDYNSPYTAFVDRLIIDPLGNVSIGGGVTTKGDLTVYRNNTTDKVKIDFGAYSYLESRNVNADNVSTNFQHAFPFFEIGDIH